MKSNTTIVVDGSTVGTDVRTKFVTVEANNKIENVITLNDKLGHANYFWSLMNKA